MPGVKYRYESGEHSWLEIIDWKKRFDHFMWFFNRSEKHKREIYLNIFILMKWNNKVLPQTLNDDSLDNTPMFSKSFFWQKLWTVLIS